MGDKPAHRFEPAPRRRSFQGIKTHLPSYNESGKSDARPRRNENADWNEKRNPGEINRNLTSKPKMSLQIQSRRNTRFPRTRTISCLRHRIPAITDHLDKDNFLSSRRLPIPNQTGQPEGNSHDWILVDVGVHVWLDVYPARLESQPNMGLQAVFRHVCGNADICSSLGDGTTLTNNDWCRSAGPKRFFQLGTRQDRRVAVIAAFPIEDIR